MIAALGCAATLTAQPEPLPAAAPPANPSPAPVPAAPAPPPSPAQPNPAPPSAQPGTESQEKKAEQPPPKLPPEPAPPLTNSEGREVIVTLKDGQRYTGIMVHQDEDNLVLKIAGINTTVPMGRVDRVNVLPPVLDRYRAMRAAIDDNDAERLVLLAEWLRARGQWDTALAELDHVLQIQPDNGEAKRLKLLVQSQKRLADNAGKAKPTARPSKPAAEEEQRPDGPFPLLSTQDVELIKVYEVDLADPPRLVIPHDTVRQLIEQHASDPLIPSTAEGREALYRQSPARILDLMFRLQARNLYSQVRVIDEPRSMRLFRDDVHRAWLINSCATTRCHGGAEAGRLMLNNQLGGTDQVVYSNFLILDRFRLPDGKPLIDYEDPASSPLLQMGLPRSVSRFPHPAVAASDGRGDLWRPVFKSADDKRFKEAVDWMKAMYRPRPDYPVQYTPPTPQPAPTPIAGEPPVQR